MDEVKGKYEFWFCNYLLCTEKRNSWEKLCYGLILPWWPSHGRRHQICTPRKSIRNVFVMLKYGNWYTIATNSFGNSKFVIKYVHHANMKCKLRICQEYKSEVPMDNKDLCVMQMSNMAWKFAATTYLFSKSKFGNELAVFTNWFAYFNITNVLQMHLRGLQIWRRLPCQWISF